jgi:hypothetical protein
VLSIGFREQSIDVTDELLNNPSLVSMSDSDFLLVHKLLSREFSYHVLSFLLLLYHDSVNAKTIPEKSTSSAVARVINSTKQEIP